MNDTDRRCDIGGRLRRYSLLPSPKLLFHNRPVTSPFGLLGRDENALSFALGYTFSKCPRLLQQFLCRIGIGGLRLDSLQAAEIRLQEHRGEGFTDIEISLPGELFVVVEAKVGLSVPTANQCLKYLPRFQHHDVPRTRLVALVEAATMTFVQRYSALHPELLSVLTAFHWSNLIPDRARLRAAHSPDTEEGQWLRAFHRFLEQEYAMRAFTDEVWIAPADTSPLWAGGMTFHDTHAKGRIYYRRDSHGKRPLYLALRAKGQVTHLQRVVRVEHEARPIDFVPELKDVAHEWPTLPHTVWVLGEPAPLPRPIPTGGPTMRARHFSCDLDILLSTTSVRDAVSKMKQRYHSRGRRFVGKLCCNRLEEGA